MTQPMRPRDLDHHAADLPLGQLVLEGLMAIEVGGPPQECLGLCRNVCERLLAEIGEAQSCRLVCVTHGPSASGSVGAEARTASILSILRVSCCISAT